MRTHLTRQIVLSGLLISLGVTFPMAFHALGAGTAFSPMHIPVFISGFVLSLPYAAACGFLTPVISSILTGMPPAFPILPFMAVELLVYSASTCLFNNKLNINLLFSLVLAMLSGRIAAGLTVWGLVMMFGVQMPDPITFIYGSVASSIPGIAIQLLLIPPVVLALKRNGLIHRKCPSEKSGA